jgi:glycosyltransferase involved in cell wall biosynthesis
MCRSLVTQGHSVTLFVADGKGNATSEGVYIKDVGTTHGRLDRILNAPKRLFSAAISFDADIYHLHDPELLPIGLRLKRRGKRVIFDSHEDVPTQMLGKPYLNKPLLWIIARALAVYERWVCCRLSGVIAATPFIRNKFLRINPNTVDINNYPIIEELVSDVEWESKREEVCYVGGIAKVRGIKQLVNAMHYVSTGVRLNLVGEFNEQALEREVQAADGWKSVNGLGFLDREGIREVLSRSRAGLVTLLPIPNYLDALPIKMFEYMSAGIPVIASNFELWRNIIEGNDCGLCVDPMSPQSIAAAIDFIVSNPIEAERMGLNGKNAVFSTFNWKIEERKLFNFYDQITAS